MLRYLFIGSTLNSSVILTSKTAAIIILSTL